MELYYFNQKEINTLKYMLRYPIYICCSGDENLFLNQKGQFVPIVGGGAVTSVAGKVGAVILVPADVGLGNVENKSAATILSELTSGNVTTALGYTPENIVNKNVANGYAGLDLSGKISSLQLPSIAISNTFVVASQAAMLAVTAETGDVAVRTDINKSFILAGTNPALLSDWQELLTPTDLVTSVNGMTGVVTINNITGNSATAAALQTSRTIAISGDGTWSVNFDGSSNVSSTLTLTNTGVVNGTYSSATQTYALTIDSKGRITSVGAPTTITPDWANITSKPTTILGYGITDFNTSVDGRIASASIEDLSDVAIMAPTDGQVLTYDTVNGWQAETIPSGVTDHGLLTGLSDDDHTQYHNDARGDVRYYTKTLLDGGQLDTRYYTETEVDALLSGKANTSHTHTTANITDLGTYTGFDSRYYTEAEINAGYQPLDGDLTAIAALSGTSGLARKTAANTWTLDTTAYLSSNQTITLTGDTTGSGTTSIATTLANSGVTAGTYNNVATQISPFTVDAKGRITVVGTAVTITPSFASITSKPTTLSGYGITDAQPLDSDLTALAALSSAGIVTRTAANTFALRALTAGSGISITNSDGVSGDPIISSTVTSYTDEQAQDAIGTILTDTASIDFTYDDVSNIISASALPAGINHNALSNYVANQHIDHSTVSINAGTGLTGGGDITANRTISMPNVGIAGTYGSATQVPVLTTDTQGRVSTVANTTITGVPAANITNTPSGNIAATDVQTALNELDTEKVNTSISVIANNTVGSVVGGGNLSANRTLTLENDSVAPGNFKYYGTNGLGAKGYFSFTNEHTTSIIRAENATTLNFSTSAQTVVFQTETFDTTSSYNTSNGKYTAPRNGLYKVYSRGLVQFPSNNNATVDFYLSIVVNGTSYASSIIRNNASVASKQTISIEDFMQLSANDTIEMQIISSSAPSGTVSFNTGSKLGNFVVEELIQSY